MRRYKETGSKKFLKTFFKQYLPNKTDNVKQITIKSVFILLFIAVWVAGIYFSVYYFNDLSEKNLMEESRAAFAENPKRLLKENSDYKAWLELEGTNLNNPVYQAQDNSFYLWKNPAKEDSSYGSLFLDYRCKISEDKRDNNLVIYGNNLENGYLFGELDKLRNPDFFKNNSLLKFTDFSGTEEYKIYAVFVLNASAEDDDGYVYNIYRNDFKDENDFKFWVSEAKERSIISTLVDVLPQDKIITLVTDCKDFQNARLVVMARSCREGEIITSVDNTAVANKKPKHPKKWYEERNIEYPF